MLLGIASVFSRTAEDDAIDEDSYYAMRQRRMERRILRGLGSSAASSGDESDGRERRGKTKKKKKSKRDRQERKTKKEERASRADERNAAQEQQQGAGSLSSLAQPPPLPPPVPQDGMMHPSSPPHTPTLAIGERPLANWVGSSPEPLPSIEGAQVTSLPLLPPLPKIPPPAAPPPLLPQPPSPFSPPPPPPPQQPSRPQSPQLQIHSGDVTERRSESRMTQDERRRDHFEFSEPSRRDSARRHAVSSKGRGERRSRRRVDSREEDDGRRRRRREGSIERCHDRRRRRHAGESKRRKDHRERRRDDVRGLRSQRAAAPSEDEDNYVERSKRRREQVRREERAGERVPYIHGPQEDENPIIDYIIKSHKYKKGKAGLSGKRADGETIAQVIMDTRRFNNVEDQKQLEGAQMHLAARGHMHAPMLMSEKLNKDVTRDLDPTLYPPDRGGVSDEERAYSRLPPAEKVHTMLMNGPRADEVAFWAHDKYKGEETRSRSSDSRYSSDRSCSSSRSCSPRERRVYRRSPRVRRDESDDGPQPVRERASPTYDDFW